MTSVVYVKYWNKHLPTFKFADVVKLADTRDLGSRAVRRTGSTPAIRTLKYIISRLKMLHLKILKIFDIIYIES